MKVLKDQNVWLKVTNPAAGQIPVSYGTTSTFNHIHQTGKFVIEFDFIKLSATRQLLCGTNTSVATGNGFYIDCSADGNVKFNLITVGGGGTNIQCVVGVTQLNTQYRIKFVGDGSTLTGYINGIPNTPVTINSLVTGNATTTLRIGLVSASLPPNCYIRNFKISDRYSSLKWVFPLTDITNIGRNIIDGTNSTVVLTAVQIINRSENVLKNKNIFCNFSTPSYSNYITNGNFTNTSWNWIHNTAIFKIEFDIYFRQNAATQQIFYNAVGSTTKGISLSIDTGAPTQIRLVFVNGTSSYVIFAPAMTNNTLYRIKFIGNGSTITGYANDVAGTPVSVVTAIGNSSFGGLIGRGSAGVITYSYLRNLKFYDEYGILKYFFPLTDNVSVAKDVVGGLLGAVTGTINIINKLETERWGYFNGVDSTMTIGTTSTLAWMSSGIFNLQFDIKFPEFTNGTWGFYGGSSAAAYGFTLQVYQSGGNKGFNWFWWNGLAARNYTKLLTGLIENVSYHITFLADGSNVQYIITNNETGAVVFDSGLVAKSFNTVATMSSALLFTYTSLRTKQYIKNFKIFTDAAGTIPFMSLPFQNPDKISTDLVGGLVGTQTNVVLTNQNENVLKSRNLWSYFVTATDNMYYADRDEYSMTDGVNDIPFEVELDMICTAVAAQSNRIFGKIGTTVEWYINMNTTGSILFRCSNTAGTSYIIATSTAISLNTPYHMKFTYDGSKTAAGLKIYINGVLNASTNTMIGTYTGMTNGSLVLRTSYPSPNYQFNGYLRNIKLTKNGILVLFTPLQDPSNKGKDVILGVTPVVSGVNVVEL